MNTFIINRGQPNVLPSSALSFSGTLYTVRFDVSKPIQLTGIGFFGPCLEDHFGERLPKIEPNQNTTEKTETKLIFVAFEIKESVIQRDSKPKKNTIIFCPMIKFFVRVPINGPRGKVFILTLSNPVSIPKAMIIDVNFKLQVNGTNEKFYRLPDKHPLYQTIFHEESGVEFTFYNSSKQLPTFVFKHVDKPKAFDPNLPNVNCEISHQHTQNQGTNDEPSPMKIPNSDSEPKVANVNENISNETTVLPQIHCTTTEVKNQYAELEPVYAEVTPPLTRNYCCSIL